jgi:hypothetical protein
MITLTRIGFNRILFAFETGTIILPASEEDPICVHFPIAICENLCPVVFPCGKANAGQTLSFLFHPSSVDGFLSCFFAGRDSVYDIPL